MNRHEFIIARKKEDEGDYESALAAYDKCLQSDPSHYEALLRRASCLHMLNYENEALEDINDYISLIKDNIEAYSLRAMINLALRNHYPALEDCNMFFELVPNDPDLLTIRALMRGIRAEANMETGYFQEAIKDYDYVIKYDKYSSKSYYNRAYCQLKMHKPKLAVMKDYIAAGILADDETIIKIKLEVENNQQDVIDICQIMTNIRSAIQAKRITIDDALHKIFRSKLNEQELKNYFLNNLTSYNNNQNNIKVKDYSNNIKFNPDNLKECKRKIDSCKPNNDDNIKTSDEYYYKAGKLFNNKNYTEAIFYCTKAIELAPDRKYKLYALRGLCYTALEQPEKAIADYSKVIEIDPTLGKAYYGRGLAYTDIGKYEEAITDFTKALELSKNETERKTTEATLANTINLKNANKTINLKNANNANMNAIHINPTQGRRLDF